MFVYQGHLIRLTKGLSCSLLLTLACMASTSVQANESASSRSNPIEQAELVTRVTEPTNSKDVSSASSPKTNLVLTTETAKELAIGEIGLAGDDAGKYDSLLYGREPLDPSGDEDGDGILNKDELFIYEEKGKRYLGYNSHPFLDDTDGDGLTDKEENEKRAQGYQEFDPLTWNVGPRDMAMFMELVYRKDDYIKRVLDDSRPLKDFELYANRQEYAMMNAELAPFWKVKETYHDATGFDAVLFENRSRFPFLKNGTVHVLAIRGTKGFGKDIFADIGIVLGISPRQAEAAKSLVHRLSKDSSIKNLYLTGQSLGGYLAQRMAVEADQKGYSFVKKTYTFNAPKVTSTLIRNDLYWAGIKSKDLALEGRIVNFVVDNEQILPRFVRQEEKYAISIGRSAQGHFSRSYFEMRMNDNPYFNGGKRRGMSGKGYRNPQLDLLHFAGKNELSKQVVALSYPKRGNGRTRKPVVVEPVKMVRPKIRKLRVNS